MSLDTSSEFRDTSPPETSAPIPCPLCGAAVDTGGRTEARQLTCSGCNLSFEPAEPEPPPPDDAEPATLPEPPRADPLASWLAGEPIQSVPAKASRRLWRWVRQHPAAAALR